MYKIYDFFHNLYYEYYLRRYKKFYDEKTLIEKVEKNILFFI